MIDPFQGHVALKEAIDLFDWHIIITLAIAALMTFISTFAGPPDDRSISKARMLLDDFSAMLAFSLFGFVTAYFLAQGITSSGDTSSNKLLSDFSAPFIALLSGGIAYFQIKGGNTRDRVVTGVSAFLLTCVLSYQTFYNQKTTMRDATAVAMQADRR